jgi:ATP-dependent protease HslVU (ClpYQ) ATPase subunit
MKETIIKLIQLDIQHTQFIENLNALGLTADQYYLNLNSIVFELMQLDRSTLEKSDTITDMYYKLIQEVAHTRIDRDKMQQEAINIYMTLLQAFP